MKNENPHYINWIAIEESAKFYQVTSIREQFDWET